jgi:ElaB/YqjD/DUF883 family membrane-anchored ribosome-binding protein
MANIDQKIGSLAAKVDMLIEASKRAEDKSDKSRAAMHKRVDELVDRVGGVEVVQAQTQKDITDMKPVTDDVKRWKIMGIGAMGIVGIAAAALGVTFGDVVKRVVMVMTGGKVG